MKKGIAITCGALLVLCLCALLAGQLLVSTTHKNPPVVSEPNWDSPATRALAVRACFDCHSNETTWPWYANLPPISLLVTRDVLSGREHLNFSEWRSGAVNPRTLQRLNEEIMKGRMPPSYYLRIHPTAQLTPLELSQLAQGLANTMNQP